MEQLLERCNNGRGIGRWSSSPALNVEFIPDTDEPWVMAKHAPPLVEWMKKESEATKRIGEL